MIKINFLYSVFFSRCQALIANSGNNAPMIKDTVVHENGKVLADEECERSYSILSDYYDNKNMRPLRLRKKLYEFYTAPIAKFWSNSVSFQESFN